jgi:hypothetical protein
MVGLYPKKDVEVLKKDQGEDFEKEHRKSIEIDYNVTLKSIAKFS